MPLSQPLASVPSPGALSPGAPTRGGAGRLNRDTVNERAWGLPEVPPPWARHGAPQKSSSLFASTPTLLHARLDAASALSPPPKGSSRHGHNGARLRRWQTRRPGDAEGTLAARVTSFHKSLRAVPDQAIINNHRDHRISKLVREAVARQRTESASQISISDDRADTQSEMNDDPGGEDGKAAAAAIKEAEEAERRALAIRQRFKKHNFEQWGEPVLRSLARGDVAGFRKALEHSGVEVEEQVTDAVFDDDDSSVSGDGDEDENAANKSKAKGKGQAGGIARFTSAKGRRQSSTKSALASGGGSSSEEDEEDEEEAGLMGGAGAFERRKGHANRQGMFGNFVLDLCPSGVDLLAGVARKRWLGPVLPTPSVRSHGGLAKKKKKKKKKEATANNMHERVGGQPTAAGAGANLLETAGPSQNLSSPIKLKKETVGMPRNFAPHLANCDFYLSPDPPPPVDPLEEEEEEEPLTAKTAVGSVASGASGARAQGRAANLYLRETNPRLAFKNETGATATVSLAAPSATASSHGGGALGGGGGGGGVRGSYDEDGEDCEDLGPVGPSGRVGLFICRGDSLIHIILRNTHVGRPAALSGAHGSGGIGDGWDSMSERGSEPGGGEGGESEEAHEAEAARDVARYGVHGAMAKAALDRGFGWTARNDRGERACDLAALPEGDKGWGNAFLKTASGSHGGTLLGSVSRAPGPSPSARRVLRLAALHRGAGPQVKALQAFQGGFSGMTVAARGELLWHTPAFTATRDFKGDYNTHGHSTFGRHVPGGGVPFSRQCAN